MNHLKNALWMKKRGFQITIVCTLNSPLHKASKECGLSIIAIRKPSKHYAFLSAFNLQRKLRSMGSMHVFVRSSADLSLSVSQKETSVVSNRSIRTIEYLGLFA
jgi:hypothetical protein